jgi:hypothetical protein
LCTKKEKNTNPKKNKIPARTKGRFFFILIFDKALYCHNLNL